MWAKTVVTYTYPAPYYYYYQVCDNDELTTIYRPEGYHVTRFTFDIPHSSIKKVRTAQLYCVKQCCQSSPQLLGLGYYHCCQSSVQLLGFRLWILPVLPELSTIIRVGILPVLPELSRIRVGIFPLLPDLFSNQGLLVLPELGYCHFSLNSTIIRVGTLPVLSIARVLYNCQDWNIASVATCQSWDTATVA